MSPPIIAPISERCFATVSKASQFAVVPTADADCLIMQNIKYVTGMNSGNMLGGGKLDDAFETIYFENCKFEVPKDMNFMYAQLPINEFAMINCDIKLHPSTNNADKNLLQTNTTSTYNSLIFRNNIFYCTDGDAANYKIFANTNATVASLEFKNNTIASVYPKATNGYINAKVFTAADASNNLIYIPEYSKYISDAYTGMLYSNKENIGLTMNLNLAQFGETIPAKPLKAHYHHNEGTLYRKKTSDGDPFATKDFANGIFIPIENYKAYGSKR